MKTFVNQNLVDSGDPLALLLMSQGAESFKLVPVSEWKYNIYKVTYTRNNKVIKSGYLVSTEAHIECEVDLYFPCDDCEAEWEFVEETFSYLKGRGFCETVEKLKKRFW